MFRKNERTNNAVEGWHTRLNLKAGGSNIPFYKLVDDLKEEALYLDVQYDFISDQVLKNSTRKKTNTKQEKLISLWNQYKNKAIFTSGFLFKCVSFVPF